MTSFYAKKPQKKQTAGWGKKSKSYVNGKYGRRKENKTDEPTTHWTPKYQTNHVIESSQVLSNRDYSK